MKKKNYCSNEFEKLEQEIEVLSRLLESSKSQLRKFQDECTHEIIVFTSVSKELCGWDIDYNARHRCIFCGKDHCINLQSNQFCINMAMYKQGLSDEEKYQIANVKLCKAIRNMPDSTCEEVFKNVNTLIQAESEYFKKAY